MNAYSKKILFLLYIPFIFIACENNKNESICYFGGEIINPISKFVYLCKNNTVIDTILLDKNNRFLQKYDTLSPGMYTFKHEPEYQYIYFDKGDSLMIRLNTFDFDNSLTFCGKGDEKNNFLIELFLKNEDSKNKSFSLYDSEFKEFNAAIEKEHQTLNTYYQRRKIDLAWDENFDLYAKNMLEMPYLTKKELYPIAHRVRTNHNTCKAIPDNYFNFRSTIDFNNEKLTNFSPFVRYLSSMLNNISCKDANELSLKNNIKKLHTADSIFSNKKIKNQILNNIAFTYLLEDQNMTNNKEFFNTYLKLSSDKANQNEIIAISNATQNLTTGKTLPTVNLINEKGIKVDLKSIIKNKSILFFWSSEAESHLEAVHAKAIQLHKKHPELQFIAINMDKSNTKWQEIITKYQFKNTIELRASNFDEVRKKWVVTKIHRSMILNGNGTIKNGFVNLFDANFEKNLK